MKKRKSSGSPLDVRTYLNKFEGFEISPNSGNPDDENLNETIVLDKWVRHDFPEMGFTSYTELGPP